MFFIAFLMLVVPGLISVRILWNDLKAVDRLNLKYVISDYLVYSFLIMLSAYTVMFFTDASRTVSFYVNTPAVSHILAASFVFKYSVVALVTSIVLPIIVPKIVNYYKVRMSGKKVVSKKDIKNVDDEDFD